MQRSLEPQHLEKVISEETGFEFEAGTGVDSEGQRWYLLRPRGLTADHTFGIRTTLGWRRLRIDFEPGKFAGSLLADMGNVDADGRSCVHRRSSLPVAVSALRSILRSTACHCFSIVRTCGRRCGTAWSFQ